MRRATFLLSTATFILYCSGCSTVDKKFGDDTWYKKTRSATAKAVEASKPAINKAIDVSTTTAGKAYKRMQKYLAEKDLLATFHDAGQHSEDAVLAVLRKSGLTHAKRPPATAPGQQQPKRPGPSEAAPSAPLSNVPEHFAGSLIWPVDAGIFSSEFGQRARDNHKGIDIAADVGEPVHAIADGDVIYAGDGLRGYGNVVILRHDRNMSSLYAHNSELKVRQGEHVRQGTLISLLGSTGRSTGPHVHFEIRQGDLAVNPRSLLPKPGFGQLADAGRRWSLARR